MKGVRLVVTRTGKGSISDAHTGVIPEIKPPKGKPAEPSNRLPRVILFMLHLHSSYCVFEGEFLAVTDDIDAVRLFLVTADIAFHRYIHIFRL